MRSLAPLFLALALAGCETTPPQDIPPGHVVLPITGAVVPEARACAIATAFKLTVSVGAAALTGPALANALAPWWSILDATYCTAAPRRSLPAVSAEELAPYLPG